MRCSVRLVGDPFSGASQGPFSADVEEISEQFDGFGLEEAAFDVDGVVEAGIGGDVVEGAGVAGFRVGGCVEEA